MAKKNTDATGAEKVSSSKQLSTVDVEQLLSQKGTQREADLMLEADSRYLSQVASAIGFVLKNAVAQSYKDESYDIASLTASQLLADIESLYAQVVASESRPVHLFGQEREAKLTYAAIYAEYRSSRDAAKGNKTFVFTAIHNALPVMIAQIRDVHKTGAKNVDQPVLDVLYEEALRMIRGSKAWTFEEYVSELRKPTMGYVGTVTRVLSLKCSIPRIQCAKLAHELVNQVLKTVADATALIWDEHVGGVVKESSDDSAEGH